MDTWEELQQARNERAQQLREQFSAAAAHTSTAIVATTAFLLSLALICLFLLQIMTAMGPR